MANNLQDNSKLKLFFVTIIVVASVIFGLYQWRDVLVGFWPDKESIEKSLKELGELQVQCQKELNKAHINELDKASFIKYGKGFWIEKRDGDPKIGLRNRINDAARIANLELKTIAPVQSKKLDDGIEIMEIAFSAQAPMEQISNFIVQLSETKPRFHWYRLNLRPDNYRKPKAVILSSTLRFVAITDPDLVNLMLGKKTDKY